MRFALAVLVLVVLGCATDPSSRVKKAQQAKEDTIVEATEKAVELGADQERETARVDQKQVKEAIELQKDVTAELARRDADIAKAQITLFTERQQAAVEVRERIGKMEAVLEGARVRVDTLRGAERAALIAEIATLEGLLEEARAAATGTAIADDGAWVQADRRCDEVLARAELRAASLRGRK